MKKLIFVFLFLACLGSFMLGLGMIAVAMVGLMLGAALVWSLGVLILSSVFFIAAYWLQQELETMMIADSIGSIYADTYTD